MTFCWEVIFYMFYHVKLNLNLRYQFSIDTKFSNRLLCNLHVVFGWNNFYAHDLARYILYAFYDLTYRAQQQNALQQMTDPHMAATASKMLSVARSASIAIWTKIISLNHYNIVSMCRMHWCYASKNTRRLDLNWANCIAACIMQHRRYFALNRPSFTNTSSVCFWLFQNIKGVLSQAYLIPAGSNNWPPLISNHLDLTNQVYLIPAGSTNWPPLISNHLDLTTNISSCSHHRLPSNGSDWFRPRLIESSLIELSWSRLCGVAWTLVVRYWQASAIKSNTNDKYFNLVVLYTLKSEIIRHISMRISRL